MLFEALIAISIVGFLVLGTYKTFELFVRRKERMLMIEKFALLSENNEDKEERLKIKLPFISGSDFDFGFWPLRISLLLIGIGAGCLVAFFIQIIYFNGSTIQLYRDWVHQFQELIMLVNFASISFFGGIGLLIAFLIEQKNKKQKEDKRL